MILLLTNYISFIGKKYFQLHFIAGLETESTFTHRIEAILGFHFGLNWELLPDGILQGLQEWKKVQYQSTEFAWCTNPSSFFLVANAPHRVEAAADQWTIPVCITVALMDISVLQQESCSNTGRVQLHHECFPLSNQEHRQFLLLQRKCLGGHAREICRKLSTRSNLSFSC